MKRNLFLSCLFLLTSMLYAQVPTTNLNAMYEFTGGSFTDNANGNNFTQNGTALTTVNDRFNSANNAINLGGDYLTRTDYNANKASYSFWIKTSTNDTNSRTIFDKSNRSSEAFVNGNKGFFIDMIEGKIGVNVAIVKRRYRHSQGYEYPRFTQRATTAINDGNWHHVVVTVNRERTNISAYTGRLKYYFKIYIDGNLDLNASNETFLLTNKGDANNLGTATLAQNRPANLTTDYQFQDTIDDFFIYSKILTTAEVTQLATVNSFCFPPLANTITASTITQNSFDIEWTEDGTFDLAYVPNGEPFSNAIIQNNITYTTGTKISLTGLQSSTLYKVYLRKPCTTTLTSNWSIAKEVRTKGKIYVNANATGNNDGSSFANGFTNLQDAFTIAEDDQEIWVAKGTYTPNATTRAASSFIIDDKNVKLYGGFAGTETSITQRDIANNETILSGDLNGDDNGNVAFGEANRSENSYHVVTVTAENAFIDGFTIANGHANGSGDGRFGAGVFKDSLIEKLTIQNCKFTNNLAIVGGAGFFTKLGTTTPTNPVYDIQFKNCEFNNNVAIYGSAIYSYTGGANYTYTVNFTVVNSLFTNNISKDNGRSKGYTGSAIWLRAFGNKSTVNCTLTNNTYANNQDLGTHASVNNFNRTPVALSQKDGVLNAEVNNSIFWGNTTVGAVVSKSISGAHTTLGNVTVVNSIAEDNFFNINTTNVTNGSNTDPLFTNATNNDFTLQASSPALDTGDNSKIPSDVVTDLLGKARIHNGTVDMGAYEYGATAYLPRSLTINATNGSVATNPNSTNGTYNDGTSVELTATPDAGYQFDGWSGNASGNTNPLTITMDADKTVTAMFSKIQRTLTINATKGSVATNPNPTNGTYDDGTSVELTATPDAGYQFEGWSGDASGSTNPLTITMDADKTVTAMFSKIQRTLTINATNGSVTTNPNPTNGTYDDGTSVELTATPDAGYQFDGWSGDASGSTNPLTITMDADKTVTAMFSKIQRTLTINATNGSVATNPNPTNGTYDDGTSVELTATPDAGYQFDGWSGDASGSTNPLTITMDADKAVTAMFSKIQRTLTINATNGSVATNPNPTNGTYDDGTSVELTATPDAGYQFDGWSGDASGNTNPLTITMDADKTVTAIFSKIMYTVTLNTVTNGSISASQTSGTAGTQITITATPDSGYEFNSWTGDIAGQTGNPITITLNSNITVGATFDATASVNDVTFSKAVVVYPNPVKSTLNIKTNAVSIKEITLFNVLGKKVIQSNNKNIDVSGLSKGIYIVKLESNDGKVATKKIVKQ